MGYWSLTTNGISIIDAATIIMMIVLSIWYKTHLNCCRIFICYSARWVPPLYLISYLSYHVIFESQGSISFPLIDNGSLSKYLLHGISVDPSEHNDGSHDDGGNQIPHNLRWSSLGWIPLISTPPIDRRHSFLQVLDPRPSIPSDMSKKTPTPYQVIYWHIIALQG